MYEELLRRFKLPEAVLDLMTESTERMIYDIWLHKDMSSRGYSEFRDQCMTGYRDAKKSVRGVAESARLSFDQQKAMEGYERNLSMFDQWQHMGTARTPEEYTAWQLEKLLESRA